MVKWRRMERGQAVDRRGQRSGRRTGGLPIPIGGKVSLPVLLLIAFAYFFLGGFGSDGPDLPVDVPADQLPGEVAPAPDGRQPPAGGDTEDEQVAFVATITADVERRWAELFAQAGRTYEEAGPRQGGRAPVVFTGQTSTACGPGSSATGPFYCPLDEQIYIDLDFFDLLASRFGAAGDFAQAYVLAHEVGHHVQHLLGIDAQVRQAVRDNPNLRNDLSVRQELQADCFAGVWASTVYDRDLDESGDLDEALTAAAAIGDDRIQQRTNGRVNPETWTHGSSEQRRRWFRVGFDEGRPDACDTFSVDQP